MSCLRMGLWTVITRIGSAILFCFLGNVFGATLVWNPNNPTPAGYNIYFSSLPEIPVQVTNVNLATSLDLSFLPPGRTYALYATAYDSAGLESEPSQSVTYAAQGPAQAPVIVTQPVSQTVALNGSLTLSVSASGTAPLSYQWIKDGVNIAGATASTYSVGAVQVGNAGSYTVRVSNSAGSALSSAATVTVIVPPTINTHPLSQSLNVGSALTLSVAASGTGPLSYQWTRDGANIAGATAATYSVSSIQASHAGSYAVRVSNTAGSVLSSAATITVVVPPAITTQPSSQSVNAGSALTLSVAASGTGPLSYQWIRNGANIAGATAATYSVSSVQASHAGSYTVRVSNPAGSVLSSVATVTVVVPPTITTQPSNRSVNAGSALTLSVTASGTAPLSYQWSKDGANITGATASTYAVSAVQSSDAGSYTVRVSNSAGSVLSSVATVTVVVPPTITTHPSNQSVNAGSALTLSVTASGTGPLTYQWIKNGANVPGATASTYAVSAVQSSDAGSYTVRVSNSAGSVLSSAATVTVVVPPTITTQPSSQTVNLGSALTLSVAASGTGPLSYQWIKDGANISGATASTYLVSAVQAGSAGSYTVRVSNPAGSVLSSAATVAVVVPPTITTQPLSQSVNAGSALTLSVAASGTGPLSYQWIKDGANIAGATASTYSVNAVQASHAGSYTVRVSNSAGSALSSAATVTVILPPTITTQPSSQTVNAGSALTLSVAASGTGPFSYQWIKNGANIAGATASTYAVSAVQSSDAGAYTVRVSNAAGSILSSAATVTVLVPPIITTQPLSQSVNVGAAVTLSVAASGTGSLSYQWIKDGANIPGATASTYVIAAMQSSDAGLYTAQVSNSGGSVLSSAATLTFIGAPTITTQPLSQSVNVGSALTLSVVAGGTGPFSYQWIKDGANIPGATGSTYSVSAAQANHAGAYIVRVSNSAGSISSSAAMVTVVVPPTITTHPLGQSVNVGSALALSVTANSTAPMSYQWIKDGANIAGATASTYSISAVQAGSAGLYAVRVSNSAGSVLSSAATITVVVPPTIATQPLSQSVNVGSALTLSVAASGTGPLSYQWMKDGANIAGATASTYSVSSVQASDAGSYSVRVSNSAGSVSSSTATVTVIGLPTITTQPLGQSVDMGSTLTLSVTASGTGPLSYQWMKDGGNISGATGSSYSVSSVQASHAGSYTVRVSNPAGSVLSSAAIITVTVPPTITTQPLNQSVNAGSPVSLSVTANGTAPLSYQWLKNGSTIPGATAAIFSIGTAQAGDAGSYTVRVSNSAGSVLSSAATIDVVLPPTITTQPLSQSVSLGASMTLSVVATGPAPLSYQWLKEGAVIPGATASTFSINAVQSSDVGSYTVRVSNPAGSIQSSAAMVTVVVPPTITTQPSSQSVNSGAALTLSVVASGTGPLTYQWLKNGADIPGATSSTYSIAEVSPGDAAAYTVRVSNSAATVTSSSAIITVISPPVITTQPVSQSVNAGSSLSLSVSATGSAPLSYQWLKSDVNISGATGPTLKFPAVDAADAGSYSVRISNPAGSVESSPATITVITPPAITTQPLSQTLNAGSSLLLSVTATGSLPLSYQWLRNGTVLPGATSSSYAIASAAAGDAGSYTVRISNSAGTVTSSGAVITIISPPAIITQPASVVVAHGAAVTLQVQASGSAPLAYQWSKDGTVIPGATNAAYNIAVADVVHSGVYTVRVENPAGLVESQPAILTVSLPGAPAITSQPADVQVTVGSPFALSVEASGTGPFSYQWFLDGAPIPGGTSASYQIASAASVDAGIYNVRVSNIGGSTLSQSVRVTVGTPPTIIAQPISQSVEVAAPVTFTVQAAGSAPLTYRWIRNGSFIPGASSASYTIASTRVTDEGAYQVEVSNTAGTIVSAPATLTITGRPAITANPQSQTLNFGGSFTVRVEATGAAPLSYRWIKDGAYLAGATGAAYTVSAADQSHGGAYSVEVSNLAGTVTSQQAIITVLPPSSPTITLQPIGTHVELAAPITLNVQATGSGTLSYQWFKNGAVIPGATSSSFSIPSAQVSDAGTYRVQVSNVAGSVFSALAEITVGTAPSITRQPAGQSVTAGTPVTLSVEATGSSPLSYRWLKDGAFLAGATGSSYSIASVTSSQAGSYTVEISNPVGRVISQPAFISITNPTNQVTAPVITLQPQSRSADVGTTASFLVEATGTGPLTYRWIFNGAYVSGATNVEIVFPSVALTHGGTYAVEVSGPGGTVVSQPATLFVTGAPAIVTPPQSQTISAGNSLFLSVQVSGVAPFSYRWIKSGSYIPNANSSSFSIPAVQLSDAGSYSVEVSNAGGTVVSSSAAIVIVPATPGGGGPTGSGPAITRHPASLTVDAGGSASFSVEATGTGPLTYRWIRNGAYIGDSSSAVLNMPSVSLSHAGSYSVEVSNAIGWVISLPATLTVSGAPAILSQPQSLTTTIGRPIVLDVQVSGAGPMTYRWVKGGSYLPGATNRTLHIPAATLADTGNYYVEVINGAGSIVSSTVSVNVSAQGSYILRQPASQVVEGNQPAVLSVEVSSVFQLTFRWIRNGSYIPNANSPILTIPSVSLTDGGNYQVEVSSIGGMERSAVATLTVVGAPVIVEPPPPSSTVQIGSTLVLSADVEGARPMTFSWVKDGSYVAGGTNEVLMIQAVSMSHAGNYTLVCSNSVGQVVSSPARVFVTGAPTITRQPQSHYVAINSPLELDVEVDGAAPFSYRWIKSGSYIPGATNSTYIRAVATLQDAGSYQVEVFNGAGRVFSQTAVITIGGAPAIVRQPSNQSIPVGSPLVISLEVNGVAPFTYRWIRGGSYIPDATNSTFQIPAVTRADAGSYAVQVSNGAGSVISQQAVITITDAVAATLGISFNAAGSPAIQLSLSGNPGTYQVQHTDNLGAPWQVLLQTNISSTTTLSVPVTDSNRGFFRTVRQN